MRKSKNPKLFEVIPVSALGVQDDSADDQILWGLADNIKQVQDAYPTAHVHEISFGAITVSADVDFNLSGYEVQS